MNYFFGLGLFYGWVYILSLGAIFETKVIVDWNLELLLGSYFNS
jgi:hypothetical protein